MTLMIRVQDDVVKEAAFVGNGCAISTASTNMLIELVKGKKIAQVKEILDAFFEMMNRDELSEKAQELLEDAAILQMTANMPARIKCATLSWHSLKVICEKIGA